MVQTIDIFISIYMPVRYFFLLFLLHRASFVQRFDSFWPMVASVVVSDPMAPPLSVNPNDLRTPFITPCEIDRPTTPSPPTSGSGTTPSSPRAPATTATMLTTTRRQLTPPVFVTTPPELIDLSGQVSSSRYHQ